jgi:hypothetical protein
MTTAPQGEDPQQDFSAYRELMVDERHHEIARRLLDWLLRHCSCEHPDRHPQDAFYASVFEIFCAPEGSSMAEILSVAQCGALFFLADDAPAGGVPGLQALADYFQTGRIVADDELSNCFVSLRDSLRRGGHQTALMESAVRDWVTHTLQEQSVDFETLTWQEQRALRRHTVFVPSYVACGRVVRDLLFSPVVEEYMRVSGILELAADIVTIANDIGSLEREASESRNEHAGVSFNYVLQEAALSGDLDAAVRAATERHNHLVAQFRHVAHTVSISVHTAHEPRVREYVQLVQAMVDGNLETTRHLVPHRFPGSWAHLQQLHRISA